jgi:hypothetical protein
MPRMSRAGWIAAVVLTGCDPASFRDCAIACSAETGCPDGFSCGAERLCRAVGVTASCHDVIGDAAVPDTAMSVDAPIDASSHICTSSDTCDGATSLGSLSGDTGSQQVTAMGTRAAWFRVRVTENDGSVTAVPMQLHVTLTSPATADFAPFVYINTDTDVVECSRTIGTTTTNGKTRRIDAEWGETGSVANGVDDSRFASIEIRSLSGTCGPDQAWQLVVVGN